MGYCGTVYAVVTGPWYSVECQLLNDWMIEFVPFGPLCFGPKWGGWVPRPLSHTGADRTGADVSMYQKCTPTPHVGVGVRGSVYGVPHPHNMPIRDPGSLLWSFKQTIIVGALFKETVE